MSKTIQFILFLSYLALGSLSAQTNIARSVLSNGAVVANDNNILLNATLGQPIIGMQSSAAFNTNSGFFAPASASLLMPCDSIVANLNDSGVGSLREALSCAISGDTITFAVNGTIVLTSGEMVIPPGVVINGDGADITIDAQGNSRIFNITAINADPVSIRNIYFINGGGAANAEWGGAITANGDLSLINCDFDNSAGENGGAINHANGDLDIINCAFVQNESTFQGGALNVFQSNMTIVNSIFYDNFATTLGGVIVGVESNIIIYNSTLIENSAASVGGIVSQDGNLELYNSIVYGNTATDAITLFPNSVNTASTITAQNLILGQINGSTLTYGVNNIIPNDPQIIDPANDDFSISNTSPAQGNADPLLMPADIFDADGDGDIAELINFDFDRIDRGQGVPGSTFDMGAIENEQGFLQVINTNTFGIGSLGQAIENTNINTNLNRIEFAIPGDGPHDIVLDNALPSMDGTDVVIDGATQPGYQPNRPAITIDGNDQFICLIISSDNCTVSGLRLINGDEFRVLEVGAFSDISLSFNTFVTNLGQDHIGFFGTTNSSVFNNRIGIDTNDVVRNANVTGLALSDCDNMDVQFNNLTGSGNGIALGIFGTSNSFFRFNGIGITNDNFISGGEIGVFLANATGNTLQDNSIGEFRLGIYANEGAQDNVYSQNFLFCNQDAGIFHEPGTQIDLQAPVITSATPGELVGTSQPNATIEIFQDSGCGNETVSCQGTFVASITADPDGTWSYTDAGITEGLTYTATQTAGFPENTSPFAVCQVAALIVCDIEASALGDTLTCDVQEVTLLGNSNKEGASYNWTGPNDFSSTDQNILVNEAGLYTLIATEGECADTIEVQVVADTLAPELIGLFDRAIDCISPTVQLVLDTETPGVSFAWTGPNGFTSEEQQPIISEGGSYSVTAIGPNGCESFFTVAVNEDPTEVPIADFTVNINELIVSFNNTSNADATDFQWDFGNGLLSTEFEPTTSYLTGGFKTVQLIASNECGVDTTEFVFELLETTEPIRFAVDQLTEGAPGDTVQVPVRVFNFEDVISFQFSMFHDGLAGRFIGVSGLNLSDLGLDDINIFNDSLLSVVWFSGLGSSLPDSTVIFNIDMEITATDSICSDINFGDIPTQGEVGVLVGNDIVQAAFTTSSGELCVRPFINIFGQVFREDGRPLENVEVAISSGQPAAITDENGLYEFLELPNSQTYILSPTRFTNPLEGVTAIDLALIQRHIFTIQQLNSPYKIISADVDNSRSITAIDLATIQRLILGISTDFPDNQSPWTFVDAAYAFQSPDNPFTEDFPKVITLEGLREDAQADFIAMKLGDVNNSAQEFREEEELEVLFKEEIQQAYRAIQVKAPKSQQLAAFQFDINFDPRVMSLIDIEPGILPGINKSNFNLHKLQEGLIPTLWFDPSGNTEGYSFKEGDVLFTLYFEVNEQQSPLSNRIWTNDNSLPAIAYSAKGEPLKVSNLYEEDDEIIGDQIRLEPLRPNPFTEKTEVRFYLPEAAEVHFEIFDALGRGVKQIRQFYDQGNHRFEIEAQQLGDAGWYILKMNSNDYQSHKRFILQR